MFRRYGTYSFIPTEKCIHEVGLAAYLKHKKTPTEAGEEFNTFNSIKVQFGLKQKSTN